MKKMSTAILSLAFSLSAFAGLEDLAIFPKTGDTAVVEKVNNPKGKIVFLNDKDLSFKQELNLLPFPNENAKFELEINKKDTVTYLIQVDKQWALGVLTKENGIWKKDDRSTLFGQGSAQNLTTLPDGNLALNLKETETSVEKVLLISEVENKLTILETLNAEEVTNRASELAISEDNPLLRTSLDCQGENCNSEEHELTQAGLGFAAGATAGLGISYRKHLANKYGYQLTGIGWGGGDSFFVSMGLNFMKTLHATKKTRFMAIAGLSTWYRASNEIDWNQCEQFTDEQWEADPYADPCAGVNPEWRHGATINVGLGIGMEFMLSRNIGLALELPVVVMIGIGEADNFGIYPIPNASLIYYF